MIDLAFHDLAWSIVRRNENNLSDYTAEEQRDRVLRSLLRFHETTPLSPVNDGTMIDLAGFGSVRVYFASGEDRYVLLSEVADELGWAIWDACDWARSEWLDSLEAQREQDEDSEDRRIGWDCLRDQVDLRACFVADDPAASPDASGHRWSVYGDWLISTDRLFSALLSSPWGKEFMANAKDLMRHASREVFGDQFGAPAPELSKDEAVRRARQGLVPPGLD